MLSLLITLIAAPIITAHLMPPPKPAPARVQVQVVLSPGAARAGYRIKTDAATGRQVVYITNAAGK